jgi:hypothetical protein
MPSVPQKPADARSSPRRHSVRTSGCDRPRGQYQYENKGGRGRTGSAQSPLCLCVCLCVCRYVCVCVVVVVQTLMTTRSSLLSGLPVMSSPNH